MANDWPEVTRPLKGGFHMTLLRWLADLLAGTANSDVGGHWDPWGNPLPDVGSHWDPWG
jgi:hypothetical protein